MHSYQFLFAVPGGNGHIYSALGICNELVRGGHGVTVVTSGFEDEVATTGARHVTYPSAFDDFHVPDAMEEENAEQLLNDVYIADNELMLRTLEQVAAEDMPDAVVYDEFHFIAGKLLATKLNLPGVRLSGIASNEHYSFWEDLRRCLNQRYPEEFEKTRREITALLDEAGIDRSIRQFWDEIDECNIVFIPRSFQIAGETFDGRFAFTGPSFTPDLVGPVWEPPAGDPPILVVSLGSTWNEHPDFFRSCASAFASTPWHVVLTIGEFLDPAALGELPPNVEVHAWITFLDVLRHASAFITQGTLGAVMAAVHHGCPLLIFSDFAAEAEPTANRTVAMGLGRRLQAVELTDGTLPDRVAEVVADEDIRRRVDELRREIHALDGAAGAARAIVDRLDLGLAWPLTAHHIGRAAARRTT